MENKMTNQERLEEYLVGNEKSYLKSDISNGKVIMLSGKWGSGKTFFWKEIIEKNLKKEKIPNNYISLYGKTSIQEIKNEVFLKIFEGMDIFKIDDKSVNLAKNTANLIADFTKTVSVFGVNLDLSKIVDKSFEKLDEVREKQQEEKTKALLNSGAIICFDDFERKSKDIDLNDLFGFITNLTIEFKSKVVIILNDDVFEGEEKNVFSRVKEKSVSKFLKYEPDIKDLFETIFISDERYRKLGEYKAIILKTIEETKELNARIYIQVLDNLVEWIEKNQETTDDILRCLILANINFVLNHIVFRFDNYPKETGEKILPTIFFTLDDIPVLGINSYKKVFEQKKQQLKLKLEVIDKIKDFMRIDKNTKSDEELIEYIKIMNKYENLFWLFWKFETNLKYRENIDDKTFQKINNFIETGILINE